MSKDIYDVIIIGGGPAGLSAGIYSARYGLKTLIISDGVIGGNMAIAHDIGNYPGFESIKGMELSERMKKQAEKHDVKILMASVKKFEKTDNHFKVFTTGKEIIGKKLILAFGTKHRKLDIEREEEFLGKGLSYCATCDGAFFRNKTVAVIGGGDSAFDAVMLLSDIAKKVYLIHRREGFRTEAFKINKAKAKKNVEFMLNSVIDGILGKDFVEGIKVRNVKSDKVENIKLDGLFVEIGSVPLTVLAGELGVKLEGELIKVGGRQETNIDGVFAAGDSTTGSSGFRQIVTACSEGAVAAYSIYKEQE